MKIMTVLGIRPDWIAMSRLIPLLDSQHDHTLVHTQQHYDWNLDGNILQQLKIREPDFSLGIGSLPPGEQTGKTIEASGKLMHDIKPDLLISFSDANPALAAVAATKENIKVLHLEAGLRSNDWRMPEEKNRRIIDSIADYFFTPTSQAKLNLLNEGVAGRKIFPVSKIVLDAIDYYYNGKNVGLNPPLDLKHDEFILVTLHRPEDVTDPILLNEIIQGITAFRDKHLPKHTIFAPLHPRTRSTIQEYNISIKNWHIIDPIGFLEFTWCEDHASIVFTDSGTVQEDTNWLGTKVVTCRVSTERIETLVNEKVRISPSPGNNILVENLTRERILEAGEHALALPDKWFPSYFLGTTRKVAEWIKANEASILKKKVLWSDM